MTSHSFATAFSVDRTPDEVFTAITDVRRWWTGDIEGHADQVGDQFTYRYRDLHYSVQKVTELVPARRVVWRVVDARLTFAEDPSEWTGTDIAFDIASHGERTEVRFVHRGLTPEFECFDNCSNGWGFYINGSLRHLITTGDGPTPPPWA